MRSESGTSSRALQKWGAGAAFLLAVCFIVAPLIYLTGNLRDALGPFNYALADLLYGPMFAASLITMVFALRERIGTHAPRRTSLALLAAVLAAGAMTAVACIRAANRQYHLAHPELQLESAQTVLIVWTTILAGLTGAGWHFLGWAWGLIGWAGWSSAQLPRALSALYLLAGVISLLVYALPAKEGFAALLGLVVSAWQGSLLLRESRPESKRRQKRAS